MFKFKHIFNKRNAFIFSSLSIIPAYKIIFDKNKTKTFSLEEVQKHNKIGDSWIIYDNKVYNVSDFIKYHPGGKDKIMEAAGGNVKPFWDIYTQHYSENVTDILKEYYIGDLRETQIQSNPKIEIQNKEAYKNDPVRSDNLQILKKEPFNAQPSLIDLRKNYITPNEYWYIRNHHPVPDIDTDTYKLKISTPFFSKEYKLEDIKKFKKNTLVNTIQCAGNRRKEYREFMEVMGLNWNGSAISTGKFGGVFLRDLFSDLYIDINNYNNVNLNNNDYCYLQLIGYDEPFDGSIIIDKNINLLKDTMLAYEMNDKELERDHGYPLRIIIPGYTGAKNIKWLKEIKISKEESESTWQKGVAYKSFGPNVKNFESINEKDKKDTPTVEKLPVQSFICDIEEKSDYLEIKGIAYSGGGNNIIRVDVSINDGNSWIKAELNEGKEQKKYQAYAWTFWTAKIPVENQKSFNIICKATDINYNTQPNNIKDIWNLRGILNNSWHKITYRIKS